MVICSASTGEGEGQNERRLGRLVSETSWRGGAGRGMALCTFSPPRRAGHLGGCACCIMLGSMDSLDLKTLLVGDMYLKCHLFLKVCILNNLKYYFNRVRHFSGEMKRKGDRERVSGTGS